MSRKMLALLEIDADGTIHVTSGPEVRKGTIADNWFDAPNRREATIAPDVVLTRVVSRGVKDLATMAGPPHATPAEAALAFVHALRWLAGEGKRP